MDNEEMIIEEAVSEKKQQTAGVDGEMQFLKDAKTNIAESKKLEDEIKRLTSEAKKAGKALNNAKKEVEDQIDKAWKAGREEAYGDLAAEVNRQQKELNKLKSERAASREKGVANRIDKETEYLYTENRAKKAQIVSMYKSDKVPFFCRSRYYFALFAPKGAVDLLILIATQLVAFGAIPMLIYYLIPERKTLHLVIIYIIAVVLFGGIYALILNFTKIKHAKAISDARDISLQIRSNKKKIKAIEKNIVNDEDESSYGLGEIDNKISELKSAFDASSSELAQAKDEFENVTKGNIKAEIDAKNEDRLRALEEDCKAKESELKAAEDELYRLDKEYEDTYMERIPKEYLKEQKLNRLIEIMENGDAETLESAILIMKSTGK